MNNKSLVFRSLASSVPHDRNCEVKAITLPGLRYRTESYRKRLGIQEVKAAMRKDLVDKMGTVIDIRIIPNLKWTTNKDSLRMPIVNTAHRNHVNAQEYKAAMREYLLNSGAAY